jgi:predicted permease
MLNRLPLQEGSLVPAEKGPRAGNLWTLVEQFAADARFSFRTMRRNRTMTAMAVLSLGLGIGANTAIFSLANAALFRDLPVDHPENLDRLTVYYHDSSYPGVLYRQFREVSGRARSFSAVMGRHRMPWSSSMAFGAYTDVAQVDLVSGNYFTGLGARPFLGGVFTNDVDRDQGGQAPVVLSFLCWHSKLGADQAAIGKAIRIGAHSYTIIGVAGPGFHGVEVGSAPDAWIPIRRLDDFYGGHGSTSLGTSLSLNVLARRTPRVSRERAQAELDVSYRQILENDPDFMARNRKYVAEHGFPRLVLSPGGRGYSLIRERFQGPLLLVLSLAGLELLLVCINIAGLLLARSSARRREIGVRLALGAGRARLVRQLLTESAFLSLLGGTLGAGFATWGIQLLVTFLPADQLTLFAGAPTDPRVLAFTFFVSVATVLVLGLAPALRSTRAQLCPALSRDEPPPRAGRRPKLVSVVMVAQVALSLALISAAGLFFRTLRNAAETLSGVATENVVQIRVNPTQAGYSAERSNAFRWHVEDRLRSLPGVRDIGSSNQGLPLSRSFTQDGAKTPTNGAPGVQYQRIAGDYFAAVGTPIVRGRAFNPDDAAEGRTVVVVNEAYARSRLRGEDPSGQRFAPDPFDARFLRLASEYEIVGVARDVRGVDHPAPPTVFLNGGRGAPAGDFFYIRSNREAEGYLSEVLRAVRLIDPDVQISGTTLDSLKEGALAQERLTAALAGLFGVLAALVAVTGVYGLAAYSVSRRTREIGIRIALGATPSSVVWAALRGPLMLTGAGIAMGIPLTLGISRSAANMLFGLKPYDPLTLAAAVTGLACVATLAAWIPARRAARLNPVAALRGE